MAFRWSNLQVSAMSGSGDIVREAFQKSWECSAVDVAFESSAWRQRSLLSPQVLRIWRLDNRVALLIC